jgi:hypothetical protein
MILDYLDKFSFRVNSKVTYNTNTFPIVVFIYLFTDL